MNQIQLKKINNFTDEQCKQLRHLLKLEAHFSGDPNVNATQATARLASNTFHDDFVRKYFPLIPFVFHSERLISEFDSTVVPNMRIDSVRGPDGTKTAVDRELDLDWFTDMYAVGGSGDGAVFSYAVGKVLWVGIRANDGITGYSGPFQDPGEVTAALFAYHGLRYSDIFTPEFMERECPETRSVSEEGG